MKKILNNLILLGILMGGLIVQAPAVLALTKEEVCDTYLNNQQKLSEDAKKAAETAANSAATDADKANAKTAASNLQKMFIITEERLGVADNTNSYDCYRKITCTVTKAETSPAGSTTTAASSSSSSSTSTPPASSSGSSGSTPQPAGPKKPDLIRKCTPSYTSSSCMGESNLLSNDPKKRSEQMAMTEGASGYTICEPIRVYVASAGTELLYYYMGQIYRYAATLGGMLAVLILIVAGIMRTTAGDNTNQIGAANNLIQKCLYGLALLFLSAIILYTINPNFFVIS